MSNEEISKKLGTPFPQSAIQIHPQTKLKYVAGHTYIHRLNDATGNAWDWRIVRQDFHPYGATGKGNPRLLITVIGDLTIPGLGTRAGMGVQVVTADTGGEDMWKGAMTDAIKSAAKLFGVGLELYGPDYEAGEIAAPVQRQREVSAAGYEMPPVHNAPQTHQQPRRDAQPRQQASGGGRVEQEATPRQVQFIAAIARELGMSEEELRAESSQSFSRDVSALNRRDASIFIERLQQRRANGQFSKPAGGPPDPYEPADDTDSHNDSDVPAMIEAFNRSDLAAKHRQ